MIEQVDREDIIEGIVDEAFAKVSRNPSDYESVTAWRDAASIAYDRGAQAMVARIVKWQQGRGFYHNASMIAEAFGT